MRASEIDHVVFYDKPFLKFERLLETYLAFAPSGFGSFARSLPVWLKNKLFQKQGITRDLFHRTQLISGGCAIDAADDGQMLQRIDHIQQVIEEIFFLGRALHIGSLGALDVRNLRRLGGLRARRVPYGGIATIVLRTGS